MRIWARGPTLTEPCASTLRAMSKAPSPAAPDEFVIMWRDDPVLGWTALQRGMQEALARLGIPRIRRQPTQWIRTFAGGLAKTGLVRNVARVGRRRLVTLSWASDGPVVPDGVWCEIVPWLYDCWEPNWPRWERMLRRQRVRRAFFTARPAAEHFARAIPGLATHWLPECQEMGLLRPGKPLAERGIHVLEMGRRFRAVHERIREPLEKAGKVHVYDKGAHGSAVPGLAALYERMGDSAVMMCYPKSMTHPDGAGKVETVTQRYLEALGSGCLPVGYCPAELKDLMGYDPVVALSDDDPAAHLLDVLTRLGEFQPMVDRSLARVREVGNFDVRAREMLAKIRAFDRNDPDNTSAPGA